MKKFMSLFLVLTVIALGLVGCAKPADESQGNTVPADASSEAVDSGNAEATTTEQPEVEKVKVGMVTDSGTIDDKSFNQGTWEGIKKYEADKGTIEAKYLQPSGETKADYLASIADLVDYGAEIIVTPGYKFEQAIYEAQELYPEVKFILLDGAPNDGDFKNGPTYRIDPNVAAVFFAEQEAGFMVGVAAALSSETGKLGFIGGMEIPPVQKFGWGFQAGVKYANDNYGTTAEVADYVYQGSFNDVAAGTSLAAGMYSKGIDTIFTAAGGVGVGVFSEAKERVLQGENIYVVGVDVDQYDFGKVSTEADAKSVTLTSALKSIDGMAYKFIDDIMNGTFEGGKEFRMSVKDNGVDIPKENPNLAAEVFEKVQEVRGLINDGTIVVPDTEEALNEFLK